MLNQVLGRLVQHNTKINLQKCIFGSKVVSSLGFRLTEVCIKPGTDKLKAGGCSPAAGSICRSTVKSIEIFLLNSELPNKAKCQTHVKLYAKDCFIVDDIIWRCVKRQSS
jgi:hypothetical protein